MAEEKKAEKSTGERINPVLKELEMTILNHQVQVGRKPNYPDDALFSATNIFMSVILDRMYDLQDYDGLILEDRIKMVTKCGHDLRVLIKSYTGVDTYTHNYKEKGK